ncbi:MAG: aminotransferase class I/II-fold pyridoxal phosphate-dependent enzyme [Gammaproteobacteria bacterium]|nr:aminotransferase class I/II-fold pyridoxal phosphate-dependent enzyme [Gammaproteobacteria bacterium]
METILQQARTLIYTTAPPPALAAAILKALAIMQQEQWRRDKLRELVAYWRSQAQERGLPLFDSRTAIQPLMIGANDKTAAVSNALLERGLLVSAIRPPTVREGSARLRITLTAAHEKADIDRLITVLTAVL